MEIYSSRLHGLKREAANNLAPSGFKVVLRGESGYDNARQISNARFDFEPSAIAFPRSRAQVVQCLRFCQDNKIEMRVRSGGHQHEGMCSGRDVLMVRLSEMNQIQFTDASMRSAWIQVGARLEDVYQELAVDGKIIPGGGCKSVNVGGLTLGGGWGLSARNFGLACDNVLEIEGVLANGEVFTATPSNEYKDLFWALLGSGGGNFAIVTRFRFHLSDIKPTLSSYKIYWSAKQRQKVICKWLSRLRRLPNRTTSYLVLYANLEDELSYLVPPVYAGALSYCEQRTLEGDVASWTQGISPARGPEFFTRPKKSKPDAPGISAPAEASPAEFDFLGWLPSEHLIELQEPSLDEATAGHGKAPDCRASFPAENCLEPYPHKVTSAFPVDYDGSDADIEKFQNRFAQVISEFLEHNPVDRYVKSYISLYSMGGAIQEIRPAETAFWYRNKPFVIQIESWWSYPKAQHEACREDPSWQEPYIEWVRNFRRSLQDAELIEGAFINFADADLEPAEYYGGNLERLKQAKAKWDPSNFFHFEMSIPVD